MKDYGKVYLKAAKKIAAGQEDFSCNAVRRINKDALQLYERVFFYRRKREEGLVNPNLITRAVGIRGDDRAFRVLLLCVAAACWRDMLPLLEGK